MLKVVVVAVSLLAVPSMSLAFSANVIPIAKKGEDGGKGDKGEKKKDKGDKGDKGGKGDKGDWGSRDRDHRGRHGRHGHGRHHGSWEFPTCRRWEHWSWDRMRCVPNRWR